MGKKRSQVVVEATVKGTDVAGAAEVTFQEKLQFYFAQYIGLVIVLAAIALLAAGYGKEWMHDTMLCIICVALCLVGLFFHETRPWNLEKVYKEQQEAAKNK